MNSNIYNIDYDKLITWLVPGRIRRSRIIAFLKVIISGVVLLYQDVLRFRKAKLYQLMITPQVCYLEKLLNDRFDFTTRGIRIVDAEDKPPFYIYRTAELKPKYIRRTSENAPKYIYLQGESGGLQFDFIVQVPSVIVTASLVPIDLEEMKSLVKAYKLAGMRFKIQIV